VTAVVPSDPDPSRSVWPLEASIRTDLGGAMTYPRTSTCTTCWPRSTPAAPRSSPEHHDELLFIVQHQTSELWLKLVLHELLEELLRAPTLYDEFLRLLARLGLAVPAAVLERDVRRPWTFAPDLVPVFREVYESTDTPWGVYEACESLVDVEDNWQLWRFRHLRTVQRTIGAKTGTGGSSGAGFLRRALDRTFFPELYAVRTVIGTAAEGSRGEVGAERS
jgi:tryptophan 2,3-dioxygenase